ncbi:MAG: DUF123 domain-containing protein [Desulfurococcales archaeon]|nr:DUF123 domain-containing protein [Desulfurococcales archaeon]
MLEAKAVLERYRGIKGLYLLLLRLEKGDYTIGNLYTGILPGGIYVYIGSAWGPGGLGARVSRHLSVDKRIHWHIDWLTSDPRCELIGVYLFPSAKGESSLYNLLAGISECIIPGFGSSDDPRAKCHLLFLRESLGKLESALRDFHPNYIKILL